jgi:hypothetical protein
MTVNKKTIVQDMEIEFKDNATPVERMRHRDTDGDGICDYVDNAYTKPNDRYREISTSDYRRLKDAGFDVTHNCRKNSSNPDNYILRYSDHQKEEIDTILKPVLRHTVSK